jgi:O-antigen/teichoic acid export membrane protein
MRVGGRGALRTDGTLITRNKRLSGVVARLTLANVLATAAGLITGPILARALGPTGRGQLAAIVVPLMLAPFVFGMGLPVFASKESAQGRSMSVLVGSVGAGAAAMGLVGVVVGAPVATLLDEGNATVRLWLTVGFAGLPLMIFGLVLHYAANGLERWAIVIAARVAAPIVSITLLPVLYLLGQLSLNTAAAVTMIGSGAAIAVGLPLLRGIGRPTLDFAVLRSAFRFGSKVWVANLASISNYRLDQLMMIPLVPARELGLYAVAVTLAGFGAVLTNAVMAAIAPRVAKGDRRIPARALRTTLGLIGIASAILAAVTPWLLPALFGAAFRGAVGMALILLVAGLPAAGIGVLTYALSNADRPGVTAVGELIGLGITVPGLLLLLPPLGGVGAAIISLVSYTVNFMFLLAVARRQFGGSLAGFLLPTRGDVRWIWSILRVGAIFSR